MSHTAPLFNIQDEQAGFVLMIITKRFILREWKSASSPCFKKCLNDMAYIGFPHLTHNVNLLKAQSVRSETEH